MYPLKISFMKLQILLSLFILNLGCISPINTSQRTSEVSENISHLGFQYLLDSSLVQGSILIFDSKNNEFLSNDFDWAKTGFIPASTFKIANSINALENGIIQNESSILYWDGEPKYLKSWEQDMNFYQAYQRSCVPCYQEIARKTGVEKMIATLKRIGYPAMVLDSTSIDQFWLEGDSRISQFQQIDFLKRLEAKELPLSEKTYEIMKKIMLLKESKNYKLYGKTGWAANGDDNIGWFVGYARTPENTYFMATNIKPADGFDMSQFGSIRMEITLKALTPLMR
ncbi:MAG: beta-lactamase class D [Psychromonas sp.]